LKQQRHSWFRQLFEELGFPQYRPTIVVADNASMIRLAEENFSGDHKQVKRFVKQQESIF
jgi:hypothetical protein